MHDCVILRACPDWSTIAKSDTPLSILHIALARMTALRRLRVFQCRQGLPINLHNTMNLHSKCVAQPPTISSDAVRWLKWYSPLLVVFLL